MEAWLEVHPARRVGSELLRVEVIRGARRVDASVEQPARTLLDATGLVAMSSALLEQAAILRPPGLRSLDAIHLASALSIRDDLTAFVAYDHRLLEAARDRGLPVVSPGA